jgi:hypothetical protein
MKAVLVNGCSGAGKSTVAAELAGRGLVSIDADDDARLCHWVDADGRFVERPAEPDLAWFDRHRWEWDPVRLDELISAAGPATVFVCGNAANEIDLLNRFDRVLLLVIDEPTMLARIDNPSRDHDFGRAGDERELLRRYLPSYQVQMRGAGAIPIDATQPLGRVVDTVVFMAEAVDVAGQPGGWT